jgi:hypothetical protein
MDLERAMKFTVENLARVAALQRRAEIRGAAADRRMHELRALMRFAVRSSRKLQEGLIRHQRRIDQKFERCLDSLKGGSGHRKRRQS